MNTNFENLSHLDSSGKAKMVDVATKNQQVRKAVAKGKIFIKSETLQLIRENAIKKGDVLTVAEVAGIQAAKRTSELIPLCHPLHLTKIDVRTTISENCVEIRSEVSCIDRTGVEMEALTAVSVALLTIYDMCKASDKEMKISEIYLESKTKTDI